jgi:hypothetical protein
LSFALRPFILFSVCALTGCLTSASGQATFIATRRITPSVFAGATGVYTGLDSGRNLSLTAGIDVAFRPASKIHPAFEYRGMYAIAKGGSDSLKNNLGGLKLSTRYGHLHPYADILAGRGETTYANGGYQVPNKLIFYTMSSSNVISLGGGTDVFATDHLALKVDLQMQHYSSPVTISGHLYSETGTIGLVYVFHFGHKVY